MTDDTRQPAPRPSTGDVWQELIDAEPDGPLRDAMMARRQLGVARYATPLQRGNGRDMTLDAREEALDGMAYSQGCYAVEAVQYFREAWGALTRLSGGRDE